MIIIIFKSIKMKTLSFKQNTNILIKIIAKIINKIRLKGKIMVELSRNYLFRRIMLFKRNKMIQLERLILSNANKRIINKSKIKYKNHKQETIKALIWTF